MRGRGRGLSDTYIPKLFMQGGGTVGSLGGGTAARRHGGTAARWHGGTHKYEYVPVGEMFELYCPTVKHHKMCLKNQDEKVKKYTL